MDVSLRRGAKGRPQANISCQGGHCLGGADGVWKPVDCHLLRQNCNMRSLWPERDAIGQEVVHNSNVSRRFILRVCAPNSLFMNSPLLESNIYQSRVHADLQFAPTGSLEDLLFHL